MFGSKAGIFVRNCAGHSGIMFALSFIPVMAGMGSAVDYTRAANARAELQAMADGAALAGAIFELSTYGATKNSGGPVAAAKAFFPSENQGSYNPILVAKPTVSVSLEGKNVVVSAKASVRTAVLSGVGINQIAIEARAVAGQTKEGPPICLLALNGSVSGAVSFGGGTTFKAKHCAVYSNSTSPSGIDINGSASVETAGMCSAGGVSDSVGVKPQPQSNCDQVVDPFANIAVNHNNSCNFNNLTVKPNTTATLNPGTYCGGLDLKGTVTLNPGLYVLKNGQLSISSQANVTGEGVTFYLKGNNAGFNINAGGSVNLSAMTSGDYKGMVIVQDRDSNAGATNKLNGNSDTVLKGAIYTPTQSIDFTGSGSFGQLSSFMPMIADQIHVSGSSSVESDLSSVETNESIPRMPGVVLKS